MALKEYEWRGGTWQFEEREAPADAKPVERTPAPKPARAKAAARPANKAAPAPATKGAR